MDTLVTEHGLDTDGIPVLWRGKSPQDLLRERYSDCRVTRRIDAPRSLNPSAEYCEKILITRPFIRDGKEYRLLVASLIPIPERK